MARQVNANYQADLDTQFEWATDDNDPFDRELDMMRVAVALDEHDHRDGRGLPVVRLATNAVDSASIQSNAVTTSKIADAQITLAKMATGSVNAAAIVDGTITNTELAAGVAVANLGFTPVNKAGDTGVGSLSFAAAAGVTLTTTGGLTLGVGAISGAGSISLVRTASGNTAHFQTPNGVAVLGRVEHATEGAGLGILNAAGNAWDLYVNHQAAAFGVPVSAPSYTSSVATGTAPLVVASTTLVTNLNAQYLNGQLGSAFGRATHEVPNQMRAFFPSSGWVPSGWTRESDTTPSTAGRIIMNAGTSFSVGFGEASLAGGNWTHTHDLSSHQHGGNDHTHDGTVGGSGISGAGGSGGAHHTAYSGTPTLNNTSNHSYATTLPSYALVLAYKNG